LAAPVGEYVAALEMGEGLAAVDEAAGDTDAEGVGVLGEAVEVLVFEDGVEEGLAVGGLHGAFGAGFHGVRGVEGVPALALVPAVVAAAPDDVDLLVTSLADVGGDEWAGAGAVEGQAPGVADAPGVDFGTGAGFSDERVVGGDGVGLAVGAAVDVEAEDLAEERGEVLGVAGGGAVEALIVGVAAVADAEVEEAVGAEGEAAAVVVEVGLVDLEEEAFRGGVDAGVVGGGGELADVAGMIPVGGAGGAAVGAVVDVETAVFGEFRVEGEAEESAFVEALVEFRQLGAEIEEGVGAAGAAGFEDVDEADLVDDQEALRVEGGDGEGGDEAVGDFLEGLGGVLGGGAGGGGERGGGGWRRRRRRGWGGRGAGGRSGAGGGRVGATWEATLRGNGEEARAWEGLTGGRRARIQRRRLMKRILRMLGWVVVLAAGGVPAAQDLNVFIWSEYLDPEVVKEFERRFEARVTVDLYEDSESMMAKLQAGGAAYDLVVPPDHLVGPMIKLGLLRKLRRENLPNLANLEPRFASPSYDPGNAYTVAYQWGTVGLYYRRVAGRPAPDSWGAVFDPARAAGAFVLIDSMRDALGAALKYRGRSLNSTVPGELKEARDLLVAAKVRSRAFEGSVGGKNRVLARTAEVAIVYSGEGVRGMAEDGETGYVLPREGSQIWVDNLAVPARAAHPELAERFIDFLLEPRIGARISNFTQFATPNRAAREFVRPEDLKNPAIYPPPEVMAKLEFLKDLGDATRMYDQVWSQVKAR
jgi:spermidine/putrescine transport system substrate-binding protein